MEKNKTGILANPIVLTGGGTLHAHQLERRPSKGNIVDLIGAGQPVHLQTPCFLVCTAQTTLKGAWWIIIQKGIHITREEHLNKASKGERKTRSSSYPLVAPSTTHNADISQGGKSAYIPCVSCYLPPLHLPSSPSSLKPMLPRQSLFHFLPFPQPPFPMVITILLSVSWVSVLFSLSPLYFSSRKFFHFL